MNTNSNNRISLKDAVSIGIGGMVGGGIFAVLGLATNLAKGGTPIAFLIAGIIALLTAYSYSKLSVSYPDRGGTVKFINQGYGINVFSGGINNLLWVSYIIMLALYASAFGSYAPNLYKITSSTNIDSHIYSSLIVIIATLINYYSIVIVGKIESLAVIIKLIILLAFVAIGIYGLSNSHHLDQLSISNWESPLNIVAAGMVIFVAYEGFELIANAAPDIINPKKNIPKSYFSSVIFVILLYIIIAIITVGTLDFNEIATAKDYVLAEAAKPLLGNIGFTIITVAALISTFSAINASLYGGSRVSFELAEDDELPHQLTYQLWNQPIGLFITMAATLLLVNTLKLESISTAGSVGFLLIFACVNFVGFKLHKEIKANKIIPLIGFLSCTIALITLIIKQFSTNSMNVMIAIGIVLFCFIIEYFYKQKEKNASSKER
ncbi:putative transporter [Flavobacteriaceae bacterium UJ101]|nr:putative transporter [Flavobacteriaceae bacterium UJ101]